MKLQIPQNSSIPLPSTQSCVCPAQPCTLLASLFIFSSCLDWRVAKLYGVLVLYCAFKGLQWHIGRVLREDMGFMGMKGGVEVKGKRDDFAGMI